jgi:hypothetical protein
MVKSKPKTIEEVLRKFEPEQAEIAQRLRSIVKTALPDASETVRRGVITYIFDDKDFATINLYEDHVDLGLLAGSKIDDEHLKGTGLGKDTRHIKIVSTKRIDEPEITRLLKDAAAAVA